MNKENNKRQVVFIMTDTQGTNMLGCYGHPEMQTPNLDKLAKEGVKFEREDLFRGEQWRNHSWRESVIPLGNRL